MSDVHAMRAFMQGFHRAALVAPHDALGLSNLPAFIRDATRMVETPVEARDAQMIQANRDVLAMFGRGARADAGGKVFPYAGNGTAIVPVHGTLLNRFNYALPYATGYNAVRSMLNAAVADPDVERIVLDMNSFGGMAAGAFELAAHIRAVREQKPVLAVVDAFAFSAAYAVASAASKIVMSPSAEAGSIGVVSMHMNVGPALKEFGIEVEFIYAGKHKIDGNPYEALGKEARANIQAAVDRYYTMFVESVGEGRREKMSSDEARKTEAACFGAEEAVSLGLADAIMAPDAALAAFETDDPNPASPSMEKTAMTIKTNADTTDKTEAANHEAALAAATASAKTAERSRIRPRARPAMTASNTADTRRATAPTAKITMNPRPAPSPPNFRLPRAAASTRTQA